MISRPGIFVFCITAATLAGCEQLGIETPDKVAARQEADGKAVGGACRHAGRALEDCYALNRRASKAAVYAGWRDMDGYMRENNIAVVKPAAGEEETDPKTSAEAKSDTKIEEGTRKASETATGKQQTPHVKKPSKMS